MSKSNIKITGFAHTAPRVSKNGNAVLMFKTPSHEPIAGDKDPFKNTLYKIYIKSELWKKISKKVSGDTYYIIEGEVRASVTTNGAPFISVLCSSVRAVNGLTKGDRDNPKLSKLYENLPIGTDEVIPIDSIIIPESLTKPVSALNAAYKFFEKTGTFKNPIKVHPNTMYLVSNYSQYLIAKDLGIEKVPVTYNLNSRGEALDEIEIKNIPWFDPKDVIEISVKDVVLTEDIHLNTRDFIFSINLDDVHKTRKISTPIAIRPLDNGKYSLVIGVARYFAAKILDIEKIPAIITDMSHEEFVNSKLTSYNLKKIRKARKAPERRFRAKQISL